MNTKLVLFTITAALLTGFVTPSFAVELLTNGDFETKTGSNVLGCLGNNNWAGWVGEASSTWDDASWSNTACSGSHGLSSPGFNTFACTASPNISLTQTVGVSPGSEYTVTLCWGAEAFSGSSPFPTQDVTATITLNFYNGPNATGILVASDTTGSTPHTGPDANQNEDTLTITGLTPGGSASVSLILSLAVAAGIPIDGQGNFDTNPPYHYAAFIQRVSYDQVSLVVNSVPHWSVYR